MICYFYFYFISWGQEDKDEKRQENGQNLIFVNHALVGHVLKKNHHIHFWVHGPCTVIPLIAHP